MTSPHWAEVRFLVPPLSKWSAISSDMKVFKSTSWSPFLLRLAFDPLLTCVGEPGVLERTLILAIAPLRPRKKKKGFKSCSIIPPSWKQPTFTFNVVIASKEVCLFSLQRGSTGEQFFFSLEERIVWLWHRKCSLVILTNIYNPGNYQLLEAYDIWQAPC